jgi:hypothetical protein
MGEPTSPGSDEPGRQPRAGEVLALLVIVPAVGAAARALGGPGLVAPWTAALVVGLCAGTVGVPVLVWSFEHGALGLVRLTVVGAIAGTVPPALLVVSGAIGLYLLGDAEYVQWALGRGASIPLYGLLPWPRFGMFLAWSAVVGAASGVIYRLLVVDRQTSRLAAWGLALLVLVATAGWGFLLG